MTHPVAELIRDARARLAAVGIDGPDAELLAAWASGSSLGELRIDMALGRTLAPDALARFGVAVTRRLAREPLQHITGLAPFRHVELAVGPGVFTPRPETELLVDVAIDHMRRRDGTKLVLDVGTGSGAVAISIARESDARVIAVEASAAAFTWARRNIMALAPETVLLHADARDTEALAAVGVLPGSLAALVSNPPYVPHAAVPADHEVRHHDPAAALYSGADGLDLIRDLIALAATLLEPEGLAAFEHTEEQGARVRQLLETGGFRDARTHADLSGRDRVTAAVR